MVKRAVIVVVVAAVGVAGALVALRPPAAVPDDAPSLDAMADRIGSAVMEHLYLGHVPGRSAEIMLVPEPHNFLIGPWDLGALGTDEVTRTTSHPNPWDYLARVPIVLYGPGRIPGGEVVSDEVDIAGIAPLYARMLGMDGFDAAVEALPELPVAGDPPKVILTVVIDGGGWNVLQEHPSSWPTIRRLMARGTTYINATIGSAPSITGALHATFGTGFYPIDHGLPGNQMRAPDGENVDTWLQNADPRFLRKPTVSELWDEANDNVPVVGTVSYEGWHLGMIGHGSFRPEGDRDVAVLWEVEENEWWINEDYYELPEYLQETDLERLESYERNLDPRDGISDGLWFGHSLAELQENRVRPGTPAFTRFTGDAVMDVLRNERIGRDRIADLFWVEMKMPDYGGHAWNMQGPEQADILEETDAQIARFVRYLDRSVGRGNYVVALSADHGQQPMPEAFGGWRIDNKELERDLEERFGPVVEKVTPVDVYVDMQRLREQETSLEDVARYIATYTVGDNIPDDAPGMERVPASMLDDRVFAGAFPGPYLASIGNRLEDFGDSDYPQGDFTVTPADGQ